ncbi:phage head closure protein [Enterococcus casseliflavus]|uniref:phage head closure protein n=1 Tax=Enterococcus casseliflavus TaxID=37734 RepID=UPI0019192C60|nr:phage head closure protein [Enterococcus casseliflavus]MEB6213001.1 phage head closure protein [Enterococcus casseliflavus]QQU18452.1 phage head closure protein [Enterococcus casseliflavus]
MPLIKTSDLRERVSFVEKKTIKDDRGQPKTTEVEVATVWASIKEQMFKDKVATVGTVLEGTISFIIRYKQDFDINTNMKVKWNNETYEIVDYSKGVFGQDFTVISARLV